MATKTIPLPIAEGKPFSPQSLVPLEFLPDGKAVVSSLQLAEHFEIRHHHVMRDIKAVINKIPEDWRKTNFGFTSRTVAGPNNSSREEPFYLLTRDGFTLLAMGYNSTRAIHWKLHYIDAFNSLEAAVLARMRATALTEGVQQGFTLSNRQKRRMARVVHYTRKGLGIGLIAHLLDTSRREVSWLRKAARSLGRLPEAQAVSA